ncbi:hypothetical protein Bpfe_021083, partial [Biomphalaria pfeifferi]
RHTTFSAIQASCSDGAVSSSSAVTGESSNHMVFAESVIGRSRTEKATRIVRAPDEIMKPGFVLPLDIGVLGINFQWGNSLARLFTRDDEIKAITSSREEEKGEIIFP